MEIFIQYQSTSFIDDIHTELEEKLGTSLSIIGQHNYEPESSRFDEKYEVEGVEVAEVEKSLSDYLSRAKAEGKILAYSAK